MAGAEFVLDMRDYPADDGTGETFTEVVGFFHPVAGQDGAGGGAGAGPEAEPDLVGIAVLDMRAGTPAALTAWRAFRNPAGPAVIGQAMRSAIIACPCTFPATGCAALDDGVLAQAIIQAAAITANGQESHGRDWRFTLPGTV